MKVQFLFPAAMLLVACSDRVPAPTAAGPTSSPGMTSSPTQSAPKLVINHSTRTLGKADAPVRVVHFSAPW